MKRFALLLALAAVAAAAAEPFTYDRQLAVELATAYVRSHFRARPEHTVPKLSYSNPVVVSAVSEKQRHLVVVSFASAASPAGAYVVLEQCEENGQLVAAESGAVDNVDRYRKDMASITSHTFVAVPTVCPASGA